MENGKIYEAISNVMAEIGAIGKNKQNEQQKFMYRGIDDVMNALQPALVKNKVFIVPEVTSEERSERSSIKEYQGQKKESVLLYTRLGITYKFFAEDGSFIEAKVIGEAMDSGDKATNKAMSIAYKYACFQVFCIPTEEMLDPDADVHEPVPKNAKQTKSDKPKTAAPAPATQTQKAASSQVPTQEQMADVAHQYINDVKLATIRKELDRTGVNEKSICERYGFTVLADCTEELFVKVMNALKKSKSKGEK
ncbi:MAG: hypothetical protein K0R34_4098 [Herbinix sp.]|jgi:hypothetical protein|nr:hypothetical protein [Herbinix sp.]